MARISIGETYCYRMGGRDTADNRNLCIDGSLGSASPELIVRACMTAAKFLSLLPAEVKRLVELVRVSFVVNGKDKKVDVDFEIIIADPAATSRNNEDAKWHAFAQELTLCSDPENFAGLMVLSCVQQIQSRFGREEKMRKALCDFVEKTVAANEGP